MNSETQQTPYGSLPSSLSKARLADLCFNDGVQTGPFGSQLHQEDFVATGTPIITVEHLGDNRILHQDLPRVSEEDRQRLAKYSLKPGDIVLVESVRWIGGQLFESRRAVGCSRADVLG